MHPSTVTKLRSVVVVTCSCYWCCLQKAHKVFDKVRHSGYCTSPAMYNLMWLHYKLHQYLFGVNLDHLVKTGCRWLCLAGDKSPCMSSETNTGELISSWDLLLAELSNRRYNWRPSGSPQHRSSSSSPWERIQASTLLATVFSPLPRSEIFSALLRRHNKISHTTFQAPQHIILKCKVFRYRYCTYLVDEYIRTASNKCVYSLTTHSVTEYSPHLTSIVPYVHTWDIDALPIPLVTESTSFPELEVYGG